MDIQWHKVKQTKASMKDRLRKDTQLVQTVAKKMGASQAKGREILDVWNKQNKTVLTSVEDLQQALDQVGFWNNFSSMGLGHDVFETITKRYPDFKKEVSTDLFKVFDRDSDGTVCAREFLIGVLQSQTTDRDKEAEFLFEGWDEDKSGTLDRDEVKKLWQTRRIGEINIASFITRLQAYDTIIRFNKRYLSLFPDNFKQADLEEFAIKKATKDATMWSDMIKAEEDLRINEIVNKIFEKADTDKNNNLSKEEFIKFFRDEATLEEIKELTVSEKIEESLEKALNESMWAFLHTSKSSLVRACGQKIKDTLQLDEDYGIPEDVWKDVWKAFAATLDDDEE